MDPGFSQRKDMLLNALIERKGLQYLTNTAAQALDNPIFLYDMSGKILAMSDVNGHSDVWDELFPHGHLDSNHMSITEKSGVIKNIIEHDTPVIGQFSYSRFRFLGCRVRDKDSAVAIATLVEVHPFKEEDSELMVVFCKAVLFELLYRERTAMQKIPYFGLLKDILENSVSESEITERSTSLRLRFPEKMRLIGIAFTGTINQTLSLHLLRENLLASVPFGYCIIYSDTLLLLLSAEYTTDTQLNIIKNVFSGYDIAIGISTEFSDIMFLHNAYLQLMAIKRIHQHLDTPASLKYYEDILLYHLAMLAGKDHDLSQFCLPVIREIELYDQQHDTLLLEGLQGYLESGRNIQKAAHALHMHKNTLYYRLKRIEELFHLDLANEDVCFNLQYSLRIKKLTAKNKE